MTQGDRDPAYRPQRNSAGAQSPGDHAGGGATAMHGRHGQMGRLTKGALKLLLALACLLAALAALRGLVPPSLAQTVVWTQWTVVPAAELAKWRACTTAYALTGLVTTCGPPQNYTEAVWWAVTHGGTWPGGTVDAQTLSIVLSGGAIGLSLVAIVVAVAARR